MKKEYINKTMGQLVCNYDVARLIRHGMLPKYFDKLWAKQHRGLSHSSWTIIKLVVEILFLAAYLLTVIVLFKITDSSILGLCKLVGGSFLLVSMFFLSNKILSFLRSNTCGFEDAIKEIVFGTSFISRSFFDTEQKLKDAVSQRLYRLAYLKLRFESFPPTEGYFDKEGMLDFFNACVKFGLIDNPEDGYRPYFARAEAKFQKVKERFERREHRIESLMYYI